MVRQRHRGDCGVAALATLLSATHRYEDVVAAAGCVDLVWQGSRGLRVRDLRMVAGALGLELVVRRRFALAGDTGIVVAHGPHFAREGHYVVLADGLVLDSADGAVRPWRAYQALYAARFTTLLAAGALRRAAVAVAA